MYLILDVKDQRIFELIGLVTTALIWFFNLLDLE